MASEVGRKTSMRRITKPDDPSQYVDVKVIDEVSFIDPHDQFQESRWSIQNNERSTRVTHTVRVTAGTDETQYVDVERVDVFPVSDLHERGQETQFRLTGNAGGSEVPPLPPTHLKTHDFTITGPTGATLTLQRIDQIRLQDPHEQGQETIYKLSWLDDDTSSPSDLDTSHDGTTTAAGDPINPPWRLDPFQNVTAVTWAPGEFAVLIYANDGPHAPGHHGPPIDPRNFTRMAIVKAGDHAVLLSDDQQVGSLWSLGSGVSGFGEPIAYPILEVKWDKSVHLSSDGDASFSPPVQSTPPPLTFTPFGTSMVPARGTKIYTDANGSVYASDSKIVKYMPNGTTELWSITASPQKVVIGDIDASDNIVDHEAGYIATYDQSGAFLHDILIGDPSARVFEVGPDGGQYSLSQSYLERMPGYTVYLNLDKYDDLNNRLWRVTPGVMGGDGNAYGFTDLVAMGNVVIGIYWTSLAPTVDGEESFNTFDFYIIGYSADTGAQCFIRKMSTRRDIDGPTDAIGDIETFGLIWAFARVPRFPPFVPPP